MHLVIGLLLVLSAVASARLFDGIHVGPLGPLGTLLLVGVGPLGAAVMSHDWRAIANAFRILIEAIRGDAAEKRKRTLSDCYQVGRALKAGRASEAAALLERSPDPLLNACAPLLLQKSEGEDLSDTVASLSFERLSEIRGAEELFGSLARSAPAFGLIGTVLGLIDMLRALKDFDRLGPSMALAVMSTFYGLILSQVLFVPLAKIIERHGQNSAVTGELLARALHAIADGRALSAVRVLGASDQELPTRSGA